MYFICLVFPRPDCFQKIPQLMTMRIAHEVTYLNSPPPLWSTIWIQTNFLITSILRIIWNLFPVGCIFAELLNMLSENVKTFEKRRPLFPGERYAKSSTHCAFLLYLYLWLLCSCSLHIRVSQSMFFTLFHCFISIALLDAFHGRTFTIAVVTQSHSYYSYFLCHSTTISFFFF